MFGFGNSAKHFSSKPLFTNCYGRKAGEDASWTGHLVLGRGLAEKAKNEGKRDLSWTLRVT